ncbi:potassium channel protein [Methanococcoides sp. SA1]|nr:potassium channel protein [Methanococcoides sp. SA1]
MRTDEHLIVLGYGDVGKRIVEVLQDHQLNFVAVDANEQKFSNVDFPYVVGNGTEEDVLKEAGIDKASTLIITLNDDNDVIFATLISRGMKPDSLIFSRANSVRSIDKIYKAGADYVGSLSIVAGQMLAKITSTCSKYECDHFFEDIVLYEGIGIEKFHLHEGSPIIGISIVELDLIKKLGCRVLGVERDKEVTIDPQDSFVLELEDVVAVVGSREQMELFHNAYVIKN